MIKLNPGFNKGMKENLMPTDKTERYFDFFLIYCWFYIFFFRT